MISIPLTDTLTDMSKSIEFCFNGSALLVIPAKEHGRALNQLDHSFSMLNGFKEEYQDPKYPENLKINGIDYMYRQFITLRKKLQAHEKYPIVGLNILTLTDTLESGRVNITVPKFGVYPLYANEFQMVFFETRLDSKPMPGIGFKTPFYDTEDSCREYADLPDAFKNHIGKYMQYLYGEDVEVRKKYFEGLSKHTKEEYKKLAKSNTRLISVLDSELPGETREKIKNAVPIFRYTNSNRFSEGIYLIAQIPSDGYGWGRNELPYKASRNPLVVGRVDDTCYLIDNLGSDASK